MKIIELRAENFKRLKAVEIKPDGSLVVITGRNAQGKSSVLDAIWAALGGKRVSPLKPIRDGEKTAKVTLDLGDYIVSRVFTDTDTYLTVQSAEGANISNPQQLLDSLIGSISFDPLAFARMKPSEQAVSLASVAKVDFAPLNTQKQILYDERTGVNRDRIRLEGAIKELRKADPDIGKKELLEEVPVDELMKQYDSARVSHNECDRKRALLSKEHDNVLRYEAEIEALEKKLNEMRSLLTETNNRVIDLRSKIGGLEKKLPDLQAIQEEIGNADGIKERNRAIRNHTETVRQHLDKVQESEKLTQQIREIDKQKTELVTSANLPVDNLTFDESCVFFQGIPFAQCSSSEQLKVSTSLAINLNPKLRVIRISDGSLLDKENLAVLEEVATANDFQIWIERVGEDAGEIGILIEDGQVITPRKEVKNE